MGPSPRPIRAVLDEQIFLLQREGGISRYFVELLRGLPRAEPRVEVRTPFRRVVNNHALEAFPAGPFVRSTEALAPYPGLLAAAVRPRRRMSADLIHHTFYHPRFLRDHPGLPKVVTIYDMIPEFTGARGRLGNPHMAKREYVRRADLLLFISESALQDLTDWYGTPAAPCVVTHLGVDSRFSSGGDRPPGFPDQYVLYVGNRSGYKDFATLVRAFHSARSELAGVHLVCVGGGPPTGEEWAAAKAAGLAGRMHHFSLADAALPGAYTHAACFVMPSRYEGFGLPALEAMAAGTPAVLARTSALPEVGGDAALYFEPGDSEELGTVVAELLRDTARHSDLILRGRARAQEFTWARTVRKTAAAYHVVAQ